MTLSTIDDLLFFEESDIGHGQVYLSIDIDIIKQFAKESGASIEEVLNYLINYALNNGASKLFEDIRTSNNMARVWNDLNNAIDALSLNAEGSKNAEAVKYIQRVIRFLDNKYNEQISFFNQD